MPIDANPITPPLLAEPPEPAEHVFVSATNGFAM